MSDDDPGIGIRVVMVAQVRACLTNHKDVRMEDFCEEIGRQLLDGKTAWLHIFGDCLVVML